MARGRTNPRAWKTITPSLVRCRMTIGLVCARELRWGGTICPFASCLWARTARLSSGWYIEAVTILESILTDRLGSLVYGSLGHEVTLWHTLGGLIKTAKLNPTVKPGSKPPSHPKRRAPFPPDLVALIASDLPDWWTSRNHAVHAMAKLHRAG